MVSITPVITRLSTALALLLICPALATTGCGSDELGGTFQAPDRDPEDNDLGPASPLIPGTEYWYSINRSYKRTAESDSSGATQGEAQSVGHICIKITEVQDTATESYQNEEETVVMANVQVRGSSPGSTSLDFSDQSGEANTGPAVDDLTQNLWLQGLTVSSTDHGYDSPSVTAFQTHHAPRPPATTLANLPFFEVRQQQSREWAGWINTGGDLVGASSFTGDMLKYFQDTYGADITADRSRFRFKFIVPPQTCAEFTEPASCNANNCTWGRPAEGGQSTCFRLYSMSYIWRETLSGDAVPNGAPELAGNVLHLLELNYYEDGSLNSAREEISPDVLSATDNLPAELPQCDANCLTAHVEHYGGFYTRPEYPAPCGF